MVYCSDEFSRMMGYPRCDIMQSPAAGDFMAGALTDTGTVGKYLVLANFTAKNRTCCTAKSADLSLERGASEGAGCKKARKKSVTFT